MIVRKFDYGWGPEWPLKSLEIKILEDYLAPLVYNQDRVAVINSTWYGQYQHTKTLQLLREHAWDGIVLVSMIDAAIPRADWFAEFQCPIYEIGYYPGDHEIVFWAQVVDQCYQRHDYSCADHIDVAFMCLNRKPHWHRKKLYDEITQVGILEQGIVTMGNTDAGPAQRRIDENVPDNHFAPNGSAMQHGIPNDITSLGDQANWRRCFLNIVTETVWNINQNYFVSEKIFKPMIGQRPFLVYDSDGAVTWLTRRGFEPYVDDFKDITNLDLARPENLTPFLSALCGQPTQYLQSKFLDLWPKIQYNQERFAQFVHEQQNKIKRGIT